MGVTYTPAIAAGRYRINPLGSFDVLLTNKTGAPTVAGTLVSSCTVCDNGFDVSSTGDLSVVLAVVTPNVPDGLNAWCTYMGRARVLLEDGTATARDNWVRRSTSVAGRADASAAGLPDELTPENFPYASKDHLYGIGRALEDVSAGTDKLAWILLRQ
jgi:hypothetical protein